MAAQLAAKWASRYHGGRFADAQLEAALLKHANRLPEPACAELSAARALHVMTRCYATGGHSRVAAQWLRLGCDDIPADLVLTQQGRWPVPDWLQEAVTAQGGQLIRLPEHSLTARAAALRTQAASYRHIILHPHPYDVVPVLAFGSPRFKRPVLMYHATDHVFWIGASVVDLLIHMSEQARDIAATRRQITHHAVAPVPVSAPMEASSARPNQSQARAALGLPFAPDQPVALSIGTASRFAAQADPPMSDFIAEQLRRHPELGWLIIGTRPEDDPARWEPLLRAFGPQRLHLSGPVADPHRFAGTIAAADVYVEVYPTGAELTSLQVALMGIPTLIRKMELARSDAFRRAGLEVADTQALAEALAAYLAEPARYDAAAVQAVLRESHAPEAFRRHIEAALAACPPRHTLHPLHPDRSRDTALDRYTLASLGHAPVSPLRFMLRELAAYAAQRLGWR